jgi:hypothetical protein
MCVDVCVQLPDAVHYCETWGELEAALGGPLVQLSYYKGEPKPEHCLCGCDLEATAQKYGLVAESEIGGRNPHADVILTQNDRVKPAAPAARLEQRG